MELYGIRALYNYKGIQVIEVSSRDPPLRSHILFIITISSITRGAVLHSFTVVGAPSLKQAPRIPPAAAPLGAMCQALCTSWMSTVVASQA